MKVTRSMCWSIPVVDSWLKEATGYTELIARTKRANGRVKYLYIFPVPKGDLFDIKIVAVGWMSINTIVSVDMVHITEFTAIRGIETKTLTPQEAADIWRQYLKDYFGRFNVPGF